MEAHVVGVIASGLVIILTILAIYVFIVYGGGLWFYVIVAVDLVCGFFNAWLISKGFYDQGNIFENAAALPHPGAVRKRRTKAKK